MNTITPSDNAFAYATIVLGTVGIAFVLMGLGHVLSLRTVAQSPPAPAKAATVPAAPPPSWELRIHSPVGDTVPYATYATAQACDDSRAVLMLRAVDLGHAVPSLTCVPSVPPWRLWLREWFPHAKF